MNRRGFTIVELIIVITLMGILMTLGVVNLRGSQANGRDAERKVDIETLALHLETYYSSGVDNGAQLSDCTGGIVTHNGAYTIHTFLLANSGTSLVCTNNITAEVLVVGGGGGGANTGSGGGAGGYVYNSSFALLSQSYTVTVGGGGIGGNPTGNPSPGTKGGNSMFSTIITAEGGGYGTSHGSCGGGNGGSGGGGAISTTCTAPGGTGSQGNTGGAGYLDINWIGGSGGGGGAGGVGAAGSNTSGSGNGGVGLANSISGTSVYYAGGGGGSEVNGTYVGVGGNGGGGSAVKDAPGGNGATNTGGGGAGGGYNGNYFSGGNGGSGIVIIRYLTPVITHTASYPSTTLTADVPSSVTTTLPDIDVDSIRPGENNPTKSFTSATNNIPTVAGVAPKPFTSTDVDNQFNYIYQPLQSDGTLCTTVFQECRKFNLYYKLENATTDCPAPNNICMITSKNQ